MDPVLNKITARLVGLPPDPDEFNGARAKSVEQPLAIFGAQTGSDLHESVRDFLTNLMHWCDRNGVVFDLELRRARSHYTEETKA